MPASYPQSHVGNVLLGFFRELEGRAVPYAVLRNWQTLPDRPQGDVDVIAADVRAAGIALHHAAATAGYVPVRVARHTWHRIHALAPGLPGEPLVVDLQPGVTHRRGVSIPAARALAGRRRIGEMWVVDPGVEGAALLLHCALERRAAPPGYDARVREAAAASPARFAEELHRVVGPGVADRAARDPEAVLSEVRRKFRGHPLAAAAQRARALTRFTGRAPVLHARPGVGAELRARGVRISSGRLDAVRRLAVVVIEDGAGTVDDGIELSRRAYCRP
jgi:hypothetical protein